MIKDVSEMLQEYFGLTLPNDVIISILEKEPVLKEEISEWGVEDTETKSLIIDSIGKFFNISVPYPDIFNNINSYSWPYFGDSEQYSTEYFIQLTRAVDSVGGQLKMKE